MQQTEKLVKDLVKVKLTESQTAALVSFVNDRGQTIFKNSNLLKVINKNDFEAVPAELAKWVVENGRRVQDLELLRQKEIALFTK
jgi:lysozyme